MSIITANVIGQALSANEFFSFDVRTYSKSTTIHMKLLTPFVTTEDIPEVSLILKKRLPSIMRSRCFNENNFAFPREVKNTEIGHLFEHIILEYLSDLKYASGTKNPVYNGLTRWNWVKEEKGVFHIEIDSGYEDKEIFTIALQKSTELLYFILQSTSPTTSETPSVITPNYLTLDVNNTEL